MQSELTEAQRKALDFAANLASSGEAEARERLEDHLRRSGCRERSLSEALDRISSAARVVLHFHPDRQSSNRRTVAESLLTDSIYKNQFETGLSAGSRSAYPGGSRDRWEQDLFGGAYHGPGVTAAERPKYGALELIRYPDGPLPRFGSCYFVLRPTVMRRSTFTWGGSEQQGAIERLGTIDRFLPVLAPLIEEIASGGRTPVKWPPFSAPTLGIGAMPTCAFLDAIARGPAEKQRVDEAPPGRVLDSAIEAHVHGSVALAYDVEALYVDPAFSGTSTGQVLSTLATQYGFSLTWHCGFRIRAEDVPSDFRGPAMRPLAERIAYDGWIDAAVIGTAEATLHNTPELWAAWGTHADVLEQLKQLWHVLVHFGEPIHRSAA